MAGSKSNFLENAILDTVLGGGAGAFTRPGTVFIALYTVAPGEAGGGTEVSATGTAYERKSVPNDLANWPAAANGTKTNALEQQFAQATADWGTIVAWALFDAATDGNMLYYGDITPNKLIANGDRAIFQAGALTITED